MAYPSLKALGAWVADLVKRVMFFNDWVTNGAPSVYWISGFFFTQSFLTGTLQDYARTHRVPIDDIAFDFEVNKPDVASPPVDGVHVSGLYLVGASWDAEHWAITEARPGQLWCEMPTMWFKYVLVIGWLVSWLVSWLVALSLTRTVLCGPVE